MCGTKKILGLIGRNVGYSYSPLIHNTAAEELGLPFFYTIFSIPSHDLVPVALEGAKALGIAGFNVTIPYKQTVVASMDRLSPEAEAVGAVNTIVNENGKLAGYNTDIAGIVTALEAHKSLIDGYPAGIFGSGGAAMAAVEALNAYFKPSAIYLFVRKKEKAESLFLQMREGRSSAPLQITALDDFDALRSCRLVVNATPVGTKGVEAGHENNCIIPAGSGTIRRHQIVFDMVYNPMETPLLQMARKAGAITISGIDMLIGQASRSFEIWTKTAMPVDAVKTRLLELLESGTV